MSISWKTNIQKDYWEEYLLREDALKCAMYYHLRRRLATVLKENSLRIYPEFYFAELRYKADLVIVHIDEKMEYGWLGEAVTEVAALLELKFTGGTDVAIVNRIKNDVRKFKEYRKVAGLEDCQFYLAAI